MINKSENGKSTYVKCLKMSNMWVFEDGETLTVVQKFRSLLKKEEAVFFSASYSGNWATSYREVLYQGMPAWSCQNS